ncbi:MAG: hypothetical protein ACWA6U_08010 [Breznakibacter sp.]|jgi:hypothetical protein
MVLETAFGLFSGLLGTALTSFTNYKTQKMKNEHEATMVKLEKEAMIAEAQMNIQITEAKVQGEIVQLEEVNYGKNLELANERSIDNSLIGKLFASPWTAWLGSLMVFFLSVVDFLKGLMRPGLTLYLVALTSWITWYAAGILSAKEPLLDVNAAAELFTKVVDIVIYLTVSVVTWWFADRRVAKFLYRLNDGNLREK